MYRTMNIVKCKSGNENYRAKFKLLNKIRMSIELSMKKYPAPKTMFSFCGAFIAVVFCSLAWMLGIFSSAYFNVIYVVAFVICVFCLSYKLNHRSVSWVKEIDRLLVLYGPLDKESYIALQNYTRDNGMDYHYILEWLDKERESIKKRLRKEGDFSFVNRKIK